MFADAGAKPPPGMGTSTPEQVGAATVKAIERNKVEVTVAPLPQRAGAHLALVSPSLSVKVQSGSAGQKAAEDDRRRPLRPTSAERAPPADGAGFPWTRHA